MDSFYSKNRISPHNIEIKKIDWFRQSANKTPILTLKTEFEFDMFSEVDRSLWLNYFENFRKKTQVGTGPIGMGDIEFAAKEQYVRGKIKEFVPDAIFYRQIPSDVVESPLAHFYNDIVGDLKLKRNYIYPMLRNKGYFNPISIFTDELFLKVDERTYEIQVTEIPFEFTMRKIFKVKFDMTFDVGKYLEYIIVNKMAKFKLNIFPHFEFKMLYFQRFPTFLGMDKNNFTNWLNNHILLIMKTNPKILRYCFEKTKVRLDLVQRLQVKASSFDNEIAFTTDDHLNFIIQLVKGRINFGSKYSYFDIQQIDRNLIQTKRNELKGNTFAMIMFFLVFKDIYQGKLFKRTMTSEQYVTEIMKLAKTGMILKLLGL